jgi:hypothetical protein
MGHLSLLIRERWPVSFDLQATAFDSQLNTANALRN